MNIQDFRNINCETLRLEEKQLADYIRCPNLFYIKYRSKIPLKETETFSSYVSEVVRAYFARLLEGKLPTTERAKKIWDKICETHEDELDARKVLEGWGLIKLFDKYCYDHRLVIADTETPYEITINSNTIIYGKLDAIRINNGNLELFVVDCGSRQPDQLLLDMSLRYTLEIYAINKLAEKHKISCLRVLHLKSGKEFTTYRTKKDFDRLERMIANVGKSIRADIIFPREDYSCPQCPAKNYCAYL